MKMLPPNKNRYQSPPIMQIPGMPSGPFTPGEGGMSPGQVPLGNTVRTMEFIDKNQNGIDDRDEKPPRGDPKLQPIKQAPIRTTVMPPPSDYNNEDLFGAPGAGSYDSLMSQAFQEYSSGESPYAGAADFLMNRSVFDRGERPESSMPSTTMTPSYGYSDPGGMSGLSQLQAQQPGLQAQYDQFTQQIQSAQEAAQQAAQEAAARQQEQTDLATSERQALMDRIAALEGREEPDLDAFGQQLRQDILGEVDLDALRREITGEVLQIAQAEFPDVMQIRDEVMRLLPEQEQIDVENLRRQIQEAIDTGAPEEEIVALRTELQNRIRPVEEQLAGLQDERGDIAQQIGELQGQVGSLPEIDVEQIRQSIINQLPEQERIDIEALQRRIQESIDAGAPEEEIAGLRLELEQRLAPVEERVGTIRDQVAQFRESFDPAALREQIGNLRGRLEGLPNFDIDEIRRRVQEGIQPQTGPELDSAAINDAVQRAMQERGGFVPPEVLERLRAVEQREGPDLGSIREQIGELRGQLSQRPEDRGVVPPDVLERLRAVEQREGPDLGGIREQIGQLRGRFDQMPQDRGVVPPDVLERLRAVEQREGPDLSGITSQIAALENRGLPPEVLERLRAVEQREGPDEAAIAERVRSGIDPRIADLQQRFSEVDTSSQAMADRIAALREQQGQATEGRRGLSDSLAALREQQGQAAEGRRALEERLGGRLEEVRGQVSPLTERIAQLRGRLDERPTVDMDAIARRVREGIDIPQVDLGGIREQIANLQGRVDERPTVDMDAIARRVREGIDIPQVDLGGIREQIANLRGRMDERPAIDPAAIARQVRESIDVPQVDLGGIREQIANLRGRLDERPTVDMDAIARRVREGIDIPQVDLSGVQNQIAALENRGLPPEILERLRAVEQRKGPDLSNITEQIGRLRGRLDERPVIDEDALIKRIQGGIKTPQVDLSGIREQIANLRGRLDARPAGTGGVKPLPTPPKKTTFPPGYRGPRGGG